jgi:SagB-type dehydrogenase family enzyme
MKAAGLATLALAAVLVGLAATQHPKEVTTVQLPKPHTGGTLSLEQVIAQRRSVREFQPEPLRAEQIGQLCWAAQGITDPAHGYRAAPSAGALYPLELYLVTKDGLYHYLPQQHALEQLGAKDLRSDLARAALEQAWVGDAPLTMVITAVGRRTAAKYGQRAERYCLIEVGHAAQNVLLQAVALGLGAVPVGAYDDARVDRTLGLPADRRALYLIPIGKPA